MSSRAKRSHVIDGLLRPFTFVRPGEGVQALLMLVCVLLILTSYYVLKTAREGLILSRGSFGLRGDELKTYATAVMAVMLVPVVRGYGKLANQLPRIRLINASYAVAMGCLVAFYLLGQAGVSIGLAFFIWLGIASVLLIAQFWSYANDLYSEEQGKRLFAIIATGGSIGAIIGPRIAGTLDTYALMPLASGILLAAAIVFNLIERVHDRQGGNGFAELPPSGAGGFSLILHDRYLLLIASMLLVLNLVNTTGEFVLSSVIRSHAEAMYPTDEAARRELIKAFYSDFFFWVNVLSFLLQAFVVSRVIERIGVRRALFVLPLVALGVYTLIGVVGGLALVRLAKIAENGLDYSLQNTVRQALFLRTSRAVKYKAKAAIDTFFVRAGDTLSAIVVGVGIHQLSLSAREIALVNVVLVVIWIAIAAGIAHQHRLLGARQETSPQSWTPAHAGAGASA
ncbi:MAG: MFS transporter [Kofleriaceae bacterium]|nr:MFS transporter [Kofleriaceae bacterium]